MDIQVEKLNLIKWLAKVNEPSVIKSFIELKNNKIVIVGMLSVQISRN